MVKIFVLYHKKMNWISKGILWSLTDGEKETNSGRALAIDEIHNVIDFLEKIESEEISNIDFLELRACDESCAGGVLTSGNRFLSVERIKKSCFCRIKSKSRKLYF